MNPSINTVELITFTSGPLDNNTYLVTDPASAETMIIDPSFDIHSLTLYIHEHQLDLRGILLTHAHFDHIAGVNELLKAFPDNPIVGLHPSDLDLWRACGNAPAYGFKLDPLPDPNRFLVGGECLLVGGVHIDVIDTPGHSPGHVVFSIPDTQAIICGDLIFACGIGRTDLPGGDYSQLLHSIHTKILSFPDGTRLYPGHGPETTVGDERSNNPF